MNNLFFKINWESNNPIIDTINYENFTHKYQLCIEYYRKNKKENDFIYSKYNPILIIKYPININKKKNISNGQILINSTEFNRINKYYNLSNMYLTQTTYHSNNTQTIKKIKINTTCIYNECNLLKYITHYKQLSLKLNINCKNNTSNCDFAILSNIN